MIRARLTHNFTESTEGWSAERIAAIQFAVQVHDEDPIEAIYKRGTIVEGDLAERAIAAGKAVEVTE